MIEVDKNPEYFAWIRSPLFHRLESSLGTYLLGYQCIDRADAFSEILDDGAEVGRKGISGTADVQFLLNKELCLETDICFGISYIDHSAGKTYFVDCHYVGDGAAYSLDDHVYAHAFCNFLQLLVHIFCL